MGVTVFSWIVVTALHLTSCISQNLEGASVDSNELLPVFLHPIGNVTVTEGGDFRLACAVDHIGTYKLAWIYKETNTILAIGTNVITRNPRISVGKDGQRTWYLDITNVRLEDAGTYMCQVNTEDMRMQSAVVKVVVPPSINEDMSSLDVSLGEGDDVTLVCEATGFPVPSIAWRREDGNLIRVNSTTSLAKVPGNKLKLTELKRSDMGAYLCIASNGVPPSSSRRINVDVKYLDECENNNGGCQHKCTNTKKSHYCSCFDGFTLNDDQRSCTSNNNEYEYEYDATLEEIEYNELPVFLSKPQTSVVAVGGTVELPCVINKNSPHVMIVKKVSDDVLYFIASIKVSHDPRLSLNNGVIKLTDVRMEDAGDYLCYFTTNPIVELRHTLNVQLSTSTTMAPTTMAPTTMAPTTVNMEAYRPTGLCDSDLGMKSGAIPDKYITSSSHYDELVNAKYGRAHIDAGGGAWCPLNLVNMESKEFLEVYLGAPHIIAKVQVQGRFGNGQGVEFAEQFKIQYSQTDIPHWNTYADRNGHELIEGNINTYQTSTRILDPPIIATRIRFLPFSYRPRAVCMRVELFGCIYTGETDHSVEEGNAAPPEVSIMTFKTNNDYTCHSCVKIDCEDKSRYQQHTGETPSSGDMNYSVEGNVTASEVSIMTIKTNNDNTCHSCVKIDCEDESRHQQHTGEKAITRFHSMSTY